MLSMTGYGQSDTSGDGMNLKVEIQTLNSRFFDLSTRLARPLQQHEAWVRRRAQEVLARGKVTITVTLTDESLEASEPRLDLDKVKQYKALFETLRTATETPGDIRLADYLNQHDIILVTDDDRAELAETLLRSGLEEALQATQQMRAAEGANLAIDLQARLKVVQEGAEAIRALAENSRADDLERFRGRVQELAEGLDLDEDRLAQEVAILAEKRDIAEECTRLASHHQLFVSYLEGDSATGKRMGFLLQEMGREVNTIGSKGSQVEISHRVVALKDELEKLREQVQNVL